MRRTPSAAEFGAQRTKMVEWQLRRRGIRDQRVLEAMATVPRELFVPERYRRRAYADSALPIGRGQTISQPWIVAAICEALALEGSERVLEIGTGSGYSAAVLAMLADEVITVERVEELAIAARLLLAEIGPSRVEVVVGGNARTHESPRRGQPVEYVDLDRQLLLLEQVAGRVEARRPRADDRDAQGTVPCSRRCAHPIKRLGGPAASAGL